ncbi:MAG: helix-turn-helix domain-containing protein [Candidatus Micrarchaeota archaeon]
MEKEGLAQQLADMVFKPKTPSIAPFKGATLLILRFLFINGNGYSAQIAKHCSITAARSCQILQELERKGIIESSNKKGDCTYCAGTGRKNYGTAVAQCIYCAGTGKLKEKTYPIVYRIAENARPAIFSIFNAIYEINMHTNEKAEAAEIAKQVIEQKI